MNFTVSLLALLAAAQSIVAFPYKISDSVVDCLQSFTHLNWFIDAYIVVGPCCPCSRHQTRLRRQFIPMHC